MASATAAQPQSRSLGPVRISLPASVAYNANALKKTIASVVDHLGCRTCFSGADCQFSVERNLAVDSEGKLNAYPTPLPWAQRAEPDPHPWNVLVGLSRQAASNLENVNRVVDGVIAQLGGCPGCHSGRDVSYLSEVTLIGVNENLQAQRYGEVAGF